MQSSFGNALDDRASQLEDGRREVAEGRRREVADAFERLSRMFRELRCIGSQRLLRSGISMTHLHILTMLRHHGPMPMSRLAENLDVSLSSATGIVDRLEERGLVERVRVPDDRRVVMVHPTAAAGSVLEDVEVLRSDLITGLLERLDEAQLDRLAGSLSDLAEALRAEVERHPDRHPPLDASGGRTHPHPAPRHGPATPGSPAAG